MLLDALEERRREDERGLRVLLMHACVCLLLFWRETERRGKGPAVSTQQGRKEQRNLASRSEIFCTPAGAVELLLPRRVTFRCRYTPVYIYVDIHLCIYVYVRVYGWHVSVVRRVGVTSGRERTESGLSVHVHAYGEIFLV